MKNKRTKLLIICSAIALLALLVIQILWLFESGRIKEEQFNQSVSMALCKSAEVICSDKATCSSWESCCMKNSNNQCRLELDESQKTTVDSILNFYIDFYQVNLDYSFDILKTESLDNLPLKERNIYRQKLNTGLNDHYLLSLNFPKKRQFILSQLSGIIVSSFVMIAIVILLFWATVRALFKNRMILERTTDFVNNMTHELKTPVANIALASSRLIKEDLTEEKRKRFASIIQSENENLKNQIERMLDLSLLEKNSIALNIQEVNIHQLIEEVEKSFEIQLHTKDGSLTKKLQAKKVLVNGDEMHLKNAMYNLLDNAIKYSIGKPEIVLKTSEKNNSILIEVTDKGIGIDQSHHEMIFERFYRVAKGNTHDVKGFGIGLTYVKNVLEAHGGSVTLLSSPGMGSTFIITLPLK